MWLVKAIRGNTKAQLTKIEAEKEAHALLREQEMANKAEARILRAIDDLGVKLERSNLRTHENRETLIKLETQMQSLAEDMRVLKRRATGKVE